MYIGMYLSVQTTVTQNFKENNWEENACMTYWPIPTIFNERKVQ